VALAKLQLDKLKPMHQEGCASNRQLEELESTLFGSQGTLSEVTAEQLFGQASNPQ
jgi:hypothetical protein